MRSTISKISVAALAFAFVAVGIAPLQSVSAEYNNEHPYPKKYLQINKNWAGDSFDKTNVKVTFTVDGKEVAPSEKIKLDWKQKTVELTESVTGLPTNCTYTSDMPASYEIPRPPRPENEYLRFNSEEDIQIPKDTVYPLDVTNTVKCTTVATPAAAVTTPAAPSAPVGGVNAGGGSMAIVGLVSSAVLAIAGVGLRRITG